MGIEKPQVSRSKRACFQSRGMAQLITRQSPLRILFFSDCCVSSFVQRLAYVASVETGQTECPVVTEGGTGPPDRMQVRLFVYLFNINCRIANITVIIAIIQLATCNTATLKLFAVKLCACQKPCLCQFLFFTTIDAVYCKDQDQLRQHSTFNSDHYFIISSIFIYI